MLTVTWPLLAAIVLTGTSRLLDAFVLIGKSPFLDVFVLTDTAPLLAAFVPNSTKQILTIFVLIGTPTLLATPVACVQNCHNIATHHSSITYSSNPVAVHCFASRRTSNLLHEGLYRSGYAVAAAVLRDTMK